VLLCLIKKKEKMKKLKLFGIMLTFSCKLNAQNKLSGKVITENNEPIPFANIQIKNTLLSTQCNSSGEFEFGNVKNGIIEMDVQSLGYSAITTTFMVSGNAT
jgi:iron complex outermembrane receptor protein